MKSLGAHPKKCLKNPKGKGITKILPNPSHQQYEVSFYGNLS